MVDRSRTNPKPTDKRYLIVRENRDMRNKPNGNSSGSVKPKEVLHPNPAVYVLVLPAQEANKIHRITKKIGKEVQFCSQHHLQKTSHLV